MSENVKRVKRSRPESLNQDPPRLKRRRVAAGMTMRDAAAAAGCSLGLICELENGSWSASVKTLAALAKAYGCKITDLMPLEPGAEDAPKVRTPKRRAA